MAQGVAGIASQCCGDQANARYGHETRGLRSDSSIRRAVDASLPSLYASGATTDKLTILGLRRLHAGGAKTDGYRKVLGRFAEIVDRQERGKSIASLLDRFAAPFEPIDDPKDSLDVQTEVLG